MLIISASRRTDIPAFYSEWFMGRIKAGWCDSVNPFNIHQRKRIDLSPDNIACIVFWTRFSGPLKKHLPILDGSGYRYYFLYTLVDYDRELEPKAPPLRKKLSDFTDLSEIIGPERVVWRYDPIIISKKYTLEKHLQTFDYIASSLAGATRRVIISFVDRYRRGKNRPENQGFVHAAELPGFTAFLLNLVRIASNAGMEIQSCAEPADFTKGILTPGKCIDDQLIFKLFGIRVSSKKA